MDEQFIRNRITELRLRKNVSEYQMSLDLGNSQGYVQSISSGRTLPSMQAFLEICAYFEITPLEFFDTEVTNPILFKKVTEEVKYLSDDDMILLRSVLHRINSKMQKE